MSPIFLSLIKVNLGFPDSLGYVASHCTQILGDYTSRGNWPFSHKLRIGNSFWLGDKLAPNSSLHAWIWYCFGFPRSYAWRYDHHEFICAATPVCPENSVSFWSFTPSDYCTLYSPATVISESLEGCGICMLLWQDILQPLLLLTLTSGGFLCRHHLLETEPPLIAFKANSTIWTCIQCHYWPKNLYLYRSQTLWENALLLFC